MSGCVEGYVNYNKNKSVLAGYHCDMRYEKVCWYRESSGVTGCA